MIFEIIRTLMEWIMKLPLAIQIELLIFTLIIGGYPNKDI